MSGEYQNCFLCTKGIMNKIDKILQQFEEDKRGGRKSDFNTTRFILFFPFVMGCIFWIAIVFIVVCDPYEFEVPLMISRTFPEQSRVFREFLKSIPILQIKFFMFFVAGVVLLISLKLLYLFQFGMIGPQSYRKKVEREWDLYYLERRIFLYELLLKEQVSDKHFRECLEKRIANIEPRRNASALTVAFMTLFCSLFTLFGYPSSLIDSQYNTTVQVVFWCYILYFFCGEFSMWAENSRDDFTIYPGKKHWETPLVKRRFYLEVLELLEDVE